MANTHKHMLSPVRITAEHRKWLDSEAERTGNPFASIIRTLLQEKVAEAIKAGRKNA